jgi:uncharacterized protein YhdP
MLLPNKEGPDESGPSLLGCATISYADVLRREVRLDGIEAQGALVVEHAVEAEAGVVPPVSAAQQVATAAVMEPAVFPVAPFA